MEDTIVVIDSDSDDEQNVVNYYKLFKYLNIYI